MNGCRVGRVLRRLEAGEVIRDGDFWPNFRRTCKPRPAVASIGDRVDTHNMYRPLTPEEVEDYKRRMG